MEKFERVVMALCSEFGCVFASSQDVRVGERGVAFGASEGWAILPAASVYVHSPHDFEGVSSSPVGGLRVCVYAVVGSEFPRVLEYFAVCRGGSGLSRSRFVFQQLTDAVVYVRDFGGVGGIVWFGGFDLWPRS